MSRIARVHDASDPIHNLDEARNATLARLRRITPAKPATPPVATTSNGIIIRDPSLPATDPQVNLLSVLVSKLSKVKPDVADQADRWIQGHYRESTLTMGMASDAINRLRAHLNDTPAPATPTDRHPEVAAPTGPRVQVDRFEDVRVGYYSIPGPDGEARFYRITRNDNGRWYVQLQASDTLYPVRNFRQALDIMTAIRDAGPKVCAERYAELIGRCYVCGRTLTDPDSRARGIGPICMDKSF